VTDNKFEEVFEKIVKTRQKLIARTLTAEEKKELRKKCLKRKKLGDDLFN